MSTSDFPKAKIRNVWDFFALGFGSGLAPKAPGTFGTLASLPFLVLALYLLSTPQFIVLTVLISVIGVFICDRCAKDMGVHDHPSIVWDEFAGMFIAMIAIPLSPLTILSAFILFRIFDVLKPWPISLLDKHVKGGFGIMIDDVLAGVFACVCMHVGLFFLPLI